jgi:phospholipid-binding lipoprotein MlaA
MHAFDLSRAWRSLLLCAVVALGGCATTGERNPADPWERTNRQAFAFNEAADRGVLKPTAKAYKAAAPEWFRTGVGNFFENLSSPATIVNSLLQGKPGEAGEQTLRFFLNTTLGIGGVLDPATAAELPSHDEDLGQTLGSWGVPSGPFLMIPLLGPSTVRDFPSDFVDRFLRPLFWFNIGSEARWGALVLDIVDTRARLLPLDATLDRAYDAMPSCSAASTRCSTAIRRSRCCSTRWTSSTMNPAMSRSRRQTRSRRHRQGQIPSRPSNPVNLRIE